MSIYLRREADSFVFRRRVPSVLQERLGLKEIYRSLKTTVRRTARARAAQLYLATEGLFRMVEGDDEEVLSDEDIQAAITYWLSGPTWSRRLRTQLQELSPGALRTCHQELPDMLLEMARPEYRSSEEHLIEEAWSALGYSDYEGYTRGETLRKAMSALQRTLKEYVDKRVQEVFEPDSLPAAAVQDMPSRSAPANMSKISTFIERWQIDLRKGYDGEKKGKKSTTAGPYQKDVELFIGLMGDLPVGKITYDIAAEFRKKLLELPATHGKSRTGSLKTELARARENKTAPRMTLKTAKRHFAGMNSIWKWLVYMKQVPPKIDPFRGHSFPGTKSKKSARDAWSGEDLALFFKSIDYQSAHGDSTLHWLPLISLYSGLRLEEICRLRPQHDLVIKDGIYCFDIQERSGWDPKTEAGARIVPVHSWLLSHGLRDFVDEQKARRHEHIFPELQLHEEKLSSGFSRDFSRIKSGLGVGRKTAFHSFRHTFRTELESTDHKESHINAVMGHEGGSGEGRVYTKSVATAKLREVVESFSPVIDLSFVHNVSTDATPLTVKPMLKPAIKKRKLTPPTFDENGKLVRQQRHRP